jgi:hypothetical protein
LFVVDYDVVDVDVAVVVVVVVGREYEIECNTEGD